MSGVRWDMLAQYPNPGDRFLQAFQEGQKRAQERRLRQALGALQGGDPKALGTIYQIDPQLGMQIENQLYQRAERQREAESRSAMSAVLLGGGAPPEAPPRLPPPAASDGSIAARDAQSIANPAAIDPLAPLPASPGQGPAVMQGGAQPNIGPEQERQWTQYLGQVAQWADTPEKWDQAVDYFVGNGMPDAAQFKGQFSPQLRQHFMQRGGVSDAERRLIENDPEGFLTFQGKRLDVTKKQFDGIRELHGMAMRLLGGVHDQPTYDAAKQQAAQLYSSFGHDATEFLGGLPPQYSPETIKMLRLQGMDTSKQLAAIARENNIDSQIKVREQRAAEYSRHNRAMEGRPTRGSRPAAPKAPTPTTVIGRIMDKQARGEALTAAERQTLQEYRAGKGSKGGRGGGADLIGQVYQKGGKRIQYSKSAGGYVDLATGQKVN